MPSTETHEGCRACGRTDVGLKKDGALRMHVRPERKGSAFLFPDGNRCHGAGHPPKGQLGQYAKATVDLLRPEFPDLEKPHIAEIIGEAIQRQRVQPSAAFEVLLDEVGNWRLRSDPIVRECVRVACYRFKESDADQARVERLNLLIGEARR